MPRDTFLQERAGADAAVTAHSPGTQDPAVDTESAVTAQMTSGASRVPHAVSLGLLSLTSGSALQRILPLEGRKWPRLAAPSQPPFLGPQDPDGCRSPQAPEQAICRLLPGPRGAGRPQLRGAGAGRQLPCGSAVPLFGRGGGVAFGAGRVRRGNATVEQGCLQTDSQQTAACLSRARGGPCPQAPSHAWGPYSEEPCARCTCRPAGQGGAGEGEGWARCWRLVGGSLVLPTVCGHMGCLQVPSRRLSALQAPGGGDGPCATAPPAIHAHSSRGFS